MAYIDRARQIIASEVDDFFKDDTILYYLNRAKTIVTSYGIAKEENTKETLRALDSLRVREELSVNGLSFTDEGDYFTVDVNFPTTDQINIFNYLSYDGTPLKELAQHELKELKYGNLCPSSDEAYFLVGDGHFKLYVPSDDTTTDKELQIEYITFPSEIQMSDEELTDLPQRLENAIIYQAGRMMIMQESPKDPNNQSQLFAQLYQEELNINLY